MHLLHTGWWLVANEDQQTAWFPAPYLEEAAPGPQQQPLGSSGDYPSPNTKPATTTGQRVAKLGHREQLSEYWTWGQCTWSPD